MLLQPGEEDIHVQVYCNRGKHRSVAIGELLRRYSPLATMSERCDLQHFTLFNRRRFCSCTQCEVVEGYEFLRVSYLSTSIEFAKVPKHICPPLL